MNINTEQNQKLLTVLVRSLLELVLRDGILFDKNIHEQAFSHRLAVYVEKYLQKELKDPILTHWLEASVDCEYNRHGDKGKHLAEIIDKYPEKKTDIVRPDIVVHVRNKDKNFLVVEMTKSKEKDFQYAFDKVSAFVNSAHGYSLGAVVCIGKDYQNPFLKIATVDSQKSIENNKRLLGFINKEIEKMKLNHLMVVNPDKQDTQGESKEDAYVYTGANKSWGDELGDYFNESEKEGWSYKDEDVGHYDKLKQ